MLLHNSNSPSHPSLNYGQSPVLWTLRWKIPRPNTTTIWCPTWPWCHHPRSEIWTCHHYYWNESYVRTTTASCVAQQMPPFRCHLNPMLTSVGLLCSIRLREITLKIWVCFFTLSNFRDQAYIRLTHWTGPIYKVMMITWIITLQNTVDRIW